MNLDKYKESVKIEIFNHGDHLFWMEINIGRPSKHYIQHLPHNIAKKIKDNIKFYIPREEFIKIGSVIKL